MSRLSPRFFNLLLLILGSCTSRPEIKDLSNNHYNLSFSKLDETLRNKLNENSEVFFEWAQKKTLQLSEDLFTERKLFENFPKIRLHGRPTPYSIKRNQGVVTAFARLENSFDGNPMWDLISMESAAIFASEQFRLDLYERGSCLKSYTSEFRIILKNPSAPALGISSAVESFPYETKTKLSTPNVDPEIYTLSKKILKKELVSSYSQENPTSKSEEKIHYLHFDDNSDMRLSPLSDIESCTDFQKTLRFYGSANVAHCLKKANGKFYLLENIAPGEEFFVFGSYHDAISFEVAVKSLCAQLAYRHSSQLSQSEKQKMYLILSRNPVILKRLLSFAEREALQIVDAYRASLLN